MFARLRLGCEANQQALIIQRDRSCCTVFSRSLKLVEPINKVVSVIFKNTMTLKLLLLAISATFVKSYPSLQMTKQGNHFGDAYTK